MAVIWIDCESRHIGFLAASGIKNSPLTVKMKPCRIRQSTEPLDQSPSTFYWIDCIDFDAVTAAASLCSCK
jgi:hypothetical protein